jgi:hypothetical protein
MPYAHKPLTAETLLDLIKPGMTYSAYVLAHKIRAPSADVKKLLLSLVGEGKLKAIKPHKHQCFMLPGTDHLGRGQKEKPQIDLATVVQPRTWAVLTGEMTGYFAEINRRAALAMMARPRT